MLRTPVVVGLHRGAGTSTVATVLHASEGTGGALAADVVCVREQLVERALSLTPTAQRGPVLAIATGPRPNPLPPALRLRFGAVVLLPHVSAWAGAPPPSDEISMLLGLPPETLPGPLRAYAAALRELAAALVRSGQLQQPSAPLLEAHAGMPRWNAAPTGPAPSRGSVRAVPPAPATAGAAPRTAAGRVVRPLPTGPLPCTDRAVTRPRVRPARLLLPAGPPLPAGDDTSDDDTLEAATFAPAERAG